MTTTKTTTYTAEDVTKAIRAFNRVVFADIPSFHDSGVPQFTDQAQVDRFVALDVTIVNSMETRNGVAYTARMTDGEWSFDVEQAGNGGCNSYWGDYGSTARFADDLFPDTIEALDMLVMAVESFTEGSGIES